MLRSLPGGDSRGPVQEHHHIEPRMCILSVLQIAD